MIICQSVTDFGDVTRPGLSRSQDCGIALELKTRSTKEIVKDKSGAFGMMLKLCAEQMPTVCKEFLHNMKS